MTDLELKRKQRKKSTAEEFTCPELINEMLDKIPQEIWDNPLKTFIDPAGGNGNFLVQILSRKLEKGHDSLQALSTIFAVELQEDNVKEMRQRLLELLPSLSDEDIITAKDILNHNIVCHDALTWDYENWKSTKCKAKALF